MSFAARAIFIGSFVSTFAVLYYLSSYISSILTAHGYRPGDLILLGLEKKNLTGEEAPAMLTASQVWTTIKADSAAQAAVAVGVVTIVLAVSRLFKPSTITLFLSSILRLISYLQRKRPSPSSTPRSGRSTR